MHEREWEQEKSVPVTQIQIRRSNDPTENWKNWWNFYRIDVFSFALSSLLARLLFHFLSMSRHSQYPLYTLLDYIWIDYFLSLLPLKSTSTKNQSCALHGYLRLVPRNVYGTTQLIKCRCFMNRKLEESPLKKDQRGKARKLIFHRGPQSVVVAILHVFFPFLLFIVNLSWFSTISVRSIRLLFINQTSVECDYPH